MVTPMGMMLLLRQALDVVDLEAHGPIGRGVGEEANVEEVARPHVAEPDLSRGLVARYGVDREQAGRRRHRHLSAAHEQNAEQWCWRRTRRWRRGWE